VKLEIKALRAIVGICPLCLQKCFLGLSPKIDKSFSIAQWGIVGMRQKSLLRAAQAGSSSGSIGTCKPFNRDVKGWSSSAIA